jgi:hypothetical protein
LLITRETVFSDTPARSATSLMVALRTVEPHASSCVSRSRHRADGTSPRGQATSSF